jgi:hypothetical protein
MVTTRKEGIMRLLTAVVLLTGSLAGCVGDFTTERIEARYHRCLSNTGYDRAMLERLCERNRAFDYDYRLSLRRAFPDNGAGGTGVPIQVYTVN